MKKLLVIAIALFTLNGMAQERKKDSDRRDRSELRKDMTPSEIADLRSKQMTLQLDLTDAQQTKVRKLILTQTETNQKLREEGKATKGDKKERPSNEERLAMQNLRLDQQIEMKREMKSILTAEQYVKFEKMKPKRNGKREGKREGKRDDKR